MALHQGLAHLGLPQKSFLDPLPISKPPGPRPHENRGSLVSRLPSLLPPAVVETMRNFGLSCRSVTSRGDLATCPAGEYRRPLPGSRFRSQHPGTPPPKSSLYFLSQLPQGPGLRPPLRDSLGHWSPGPQPPTQSGSHSFPGVGAPSFPPDPQAGSLPPGSRLPPLRPAGFAVTACTCGSACGSWDVRAETTCHCQCAGMDWTGARCCRLQTTA